MHAFIQERINGRNLADVRARIAGELASERAQVDEIARRALQLSEQALRVTQDESSQVIVSGQSRLLEQAAEGDVEKMKALFRALEEKERILSLLEQTEQADGLQVFIGAETRIEELSDFSVVAAAYGPDDHPLGTLGVIGPNWMNYSKVIPLVDFTAELLTGLLRRA